MTETFRAGRWYLPSRAIEPASLYRCTAQIWMDRVLALVLTARCHREEKSGRAFVQQECVRTLDKQSMQLQSKPTPSTHVADLFWLVKRTRNLPRWTGWNTRGDTVAAGLVEDSSQRSFEEHPCMCWVRYARGMQPLSREGVSRALW